MAGHAQEEFEGHVQDCDQKIDAGRDLRHQGEGALRGGVERVVGLFARHDGAGVTLSLIHI